MTEIFLNTSLPKLDDTDDAIAIADYIYVMEEGKIIESGDPREVLKSKNAKVKEYFKDL